MRRLFPLLLVLLSLSLTRSVEAAKPHVSILFLGVDIRDPVAAQERTSSSIAQRRFRIRVDARGVTEPRARLYAALPSDVPGHRLSVDGIRLSTTPQLIAPFAALGAAEAHTLEVETLELGDDVMETILWTAEVR